MIKMGDISFLENSRIMITGGTGSLGKKLTRIILDKTTQAKIIIYSRDEFKQFEMAQALNESERERTRFFIGDVRDAGRLHRAMDGVDHVIHAAALKQVPAAEYNPFEFVKTNVIGAENVINACIDRGVRNVVALSTDKAANPINLYGATKLCSDKMFVAGNSYSAGHPTRFSVVRYGNVVGSRGSVIPFFLKQRKTGTLTVTDEQMTRFWITLGQGAALVLNALREMKGGEIWVPRIPSLKIVDLARVIAPECKITFTGIRPGEKLHEVMIPLDDGRQTIMYDNFFIITPTLSFWDEETHIRPDGNRCPEGFCYSSDSNDRWLKDDELVAMIGDLDLKDARKWAKERFACS